ncbi:hypothetical protein AAFF27_16980 [Xylophilus sp. GW821-FHT01B05]
MMTHFMTRTGTGARSAWPTAALLLAAALAWAAGPQASHAKDSSTVYGKTLLRSYDLPLETLARFERFNAKPRNRTGVLVDTEDWTGEPLSLTGSGNPYTLVLKVSGTAQDAGDVDSRWQPGWSQEGMTRGNPMPALGKKAAQAGERIELEGASGPISVKQDRSMAPALGFAGSSNLRIDRVQVEVWSGVGKSSLLMKFIAWSSALTGLVFLGLVWWARK